MNPLIQAIIGITLFTVIDIVQIELIQRKYAKKCGFDCSTCKNWKCFSHYCAGKRKG